MIAGRWSLPELNQLRYNNREYHQSQHRSKRRLMCIPDVKCDEIDQILICMAEWCFAFLKWWMMGCDISCLATTGNFIMVALSLVLVTGCTYRMHWCVREVWCVLCCLAWWWYDQLCTEIKSEWDLYLVVYVCDVTMWVLSCAIGRDTDKCFIYMHRYDYWWWDGGDCVPGGT